MAYRDLSLPQKRLAALARRVEILEKERLDSLKAGTVKEAEDCSLEYVSCLATGEQLARQLGYQNYDAAKADVRRIWTG